MCARITLTTSSSRIAYLFDVVADVDLIPRYNMAPSQLIPVVRNEGRGGRELVMLRWGLIPHWNTDPKPAGFVNARAETAAERPAFRDAFRLRRCLIPADGFYEWQHQGKKKQPYLFRQTGDETAAYAGIWDVWVGRNGVVESVAVLTTTANELVKPLHDRMPAVLTPDRFAAWLDPHRRQPDQLLPLLTPSPADRMVMWPVSDRVNSAAVDEPGLTAEVTPRPTREQPTLFDVG